VADPPWPQKTVGRFKGKHKGPASLPYETMPVRDIAALSVATLADSGAHLWLWTTNSHLRDAFDVMEARA